MKNLTRKILAMLLAVCLFVCLMPSASAVTLPVSTIALDIDQIHTANGYEFIYDAELSMEEDMAAFVSLYRNRWDVLSMLRFTCTLSDELTALLTAENTPSFTFESCQFNKVNIFTPVSSALQNNSLVLTYQLNPAIQQSFATAKAGDVRTALCQLMYMQSNPGFVSSETIRNLSEINTTATIYLTSTDNILLPGFSTQRALVAKGTLKTPIDKNLSFFPAPIEETGVNRLIETGKHMQIFNGYTDGSFKPAKNITRAEAVVTLYRMLRDEAVASVNPNTVPRYSDVKVGSWYEDAVYTLAALGILKDLDKTDATGTKKLFKPDDVISRADITVMLTRFVNPVAPNSYPANFSDVPASHYAYKEIMTAAAYGWVAGTGNNKFNPDKGVTRAEISKMYCMFLDRRADKFAIERGNYIPYTDVDPSHWAYEYIIEVTTPHEYTRIGSFEIWK